MIEHRFIDGKVYEAKGTTEKLHAEFLLPGMGARLNVSADVVRPLGATGAQSWRTLRHWTLYLVTGGPDMRYSPGSLILRESTWQPFIETIRDAVARLRTLSGRSVAGTYTRALSDNIAVETDEGAAYLKVTLKSDTNAFSNRYSLRQAEELLAEFERVPEKLSLLLGELEALS